MNNYLFNTILSMDSYNRGYDEGIIVIGNNIGTATLGIDSSELDTLTETGRAKSIGFYGLSYDYNGETIISYRGTNTHNEIENNKDKDFGWTLAGYTNTAFVPQSDAEQAVMAAEFYQSVAGSGNFGTGNITLTGHSLGGGLAGYVAEIYHEDANTFDSMKFSAGTAKAQFQTTNYNVTWIEGFTPSVAHSAIVHESNIASFLYEIDQSLYKFLVNSELLNQSLRDDLGLDLRLDQNSNIIPFELDDNNNVTVERIQGESLDSDLIGALSTTAQDLDLGNNVDLSGTKFPFIGSETVARHSMSTFVIREFATSELQDDLLTIDVNELTAWRDAAKYYWPVLYNDDFASDIGFESATNLEIAGTLQDANRFADIMRQTIAYSSIDEGTTVFGNTAIRALYDDANDLGAALNNPNANSYLSDFGEEISEIYVQYAGQLALNKIEVNPLNFNDIKGVITYDPSDGDHDLKINIDSNFWKESFGLNVIEASISENSFVRTLLNDDNNVDRLQAVLKENYGDTPFDFFNEFVFESDQNFTNEADFFDGVVNNINNKIIVAQSGDNIIQGGSAANIILGGAGYDTVILNTKDFYPTNSYEYKILSRNPSFHPEFIHGEGLVVYDSFAEYKLSGGIFEGIERFENVNAAVIHSLGHHYEERQEIISHRNPHTSGNIIEPYDMGLALDYSNIEDKLIFNIGAQTISNDVNQDTFSLTDYHASGSFTPIIYKFTGTDQGDIYDFSTYNLNNGQGYTNVAGFEIFSGLGDDYVRYVSSSDFYASDNDVLGLNYNYNGGDDVIEHAYTKIILPEDVTKSKISWKIIGTPEQIFNTDTQKHHLLYDLKYEIQGYGSIIIANGAHYIDPYTQPTGDWSLNYITGLEIYSGQQNETLNILGVVGSGVNTEINWSSQNANGMGPRYYGENSDDVLIGSSNSYNSLYGAGGDDDITLNYSGFAYGGSGVDLITVNNFGDAYGGGGNDILIGGVNNDQLYGGSGIDSIEGAAGNDQIYGGAGIDIAKYNGNYQNYTVQHYSSTNANAEYITSHVNDLVGNEGNDVLFDIETLQFVDGIYDVATQTFKANNPQNLIEGTSSGETILGTSSDDVIYAFAGNDKIFAEEGIDEVYGGDGNDEIYGRKGDDVLHGEAGVDTIRGDDDNDTIYGGLGNDILRGNRGEDTIHGDEGDDLIFGNEDGDTLYGGEGADTIRGEGGNDIIYAGLGDDISVYGDDGNDTIHGNEGNDVIRGGEGQDTLYGDEGNDRLYGREDDDILYGGTGNDELYGDDSENDSYSSDDIIYGESGIDILRGGNGNDFLDGGADNDTLWGDAGDDVLNGGDGNDTHRGGSGNDTYILSAGFDNILDSSGSADVLKLASGYTLENITFAASASNSDNLEVSLDNGLSSTLLYGQNDTGTAKIELIELEDGFQFDFKQFANWMIGSGSGYIENGTNDDDIIIGYGGNDTLNGADGNDNLISGSGDDTLVGGSGNDGLNGGDGNDILYGGDGDDTLFGGTGDDTYFYSIGLDTISDSSGTDVIEFGDGITLEDLSFSVTNNDLEITINGNSSNKIIIQDHLLNASSAIETFKLADNTQFSLTNFSTWIIASGNGSTVYGDVNGNFADFILGSNVSEELRGYELDDIVFARGGDDTIRGGNGADTLWGGNGNDIILADDGSSNANDTAYGGNGNDTIKGYGGDDILHGNDGDDEITGGTGVDSIFGGNGEDNLDGEEGNDIIYGGNDDDVLKGRNGNDNLFGEFGNDSLYGGADNDILDGGSGDDYLRGEAGEDILNGGAGDDELRGDQGNDILDGGTANDILYGGDGSDDLYGGEGLDYYYGGTGSDIFHFDGNAIYDEYNLIDDVDFIKDWGTGGSADTLSLENLLIGYDPVTSQINDFVQLTDTGSDTILSIDRDGSATVSGWQDVVRIEGEAGLTIIQLQNNNQIDII